MSLSKEQYDQIMRGYQERQSQNFHELNRRRRQIYALIPEYQQLEQCSALFYFAKNICEKIN